MPLCAFGHFIADEWGDCAACAYEDDMARRRKKELAFIKRTGARKDCAAGKHRIPIHDDECPQCIRAGDLIEIHNAHLWEIENDRRERDLREMASADRAFAARRDKEEFRMQAFPNGVPHIHQIPITSTGRIMTFIIGPRVKPRAKRRRRR